MDTTAIMAEVGITTTKIEEGAQVAVMVVRTMIDTFLLLDAIGIARLRIK